MDRYAQRPVGSEGASVNLYDLFIVHAAADRAWVEGYLKVELGLEPVRVITPREFNPTARLSRPSSSGPSLRADSLCWCSARPSSPTNGRGLASNLSRSPVSRQGRNRLLAVDRQKCDLPLSLRFRVRLNFTDADQAGWENEIARLRAVLDRPAPVIEVLRVPVSGDGPVPQGRRAVLPRA